MKILSVKTKDLHKYITKEINFNTEISIVTGVNGSGKTSILSLIEAILKLDINKINSISFTLLELKLLISKEVHTIKIEKSKAEPDVGMTFSVNDSHIEIKDYIKNPFTIRKSRLSSEFIREFETKINNNPDFRIFSQITPPMLIGLNRKISAKKIDHVISRFDSYEHSDIKFIDETSNKEIDSFDLALIECKKLIEDEFKRIKKYENVQLNVLRNEIITSSFAYLDETDSILSSLEVMESRFLEVKERKSEILDVLNNIDVKGNNFGNMSISFFDKLDNLYGKIFTGNKNSTDQRFTLEYLLNITQVERISKLVKIIDAHKSALDEKRKKIDLFEDVINTFLVDTQKKIVINSIGNIYVSINNSTHKIEIDELSSGEKQLVIIIANMIFARRNNISSIIIDEPEISLHIKWQDMFISALRKINNSTQLILATHSPDIIGEHDYYCTPIENWS